MINFNHIKVLNFEGAFRGLRNPLESHSKSDSHYCSNIDNCNECILNTTCVKYFKYQKPYLIGPNDLDLAQRMIKAGTDSSKFLRQIFLSIDITAPLCWWKEFDTYKVATVANSTSTMHKLGSRYLTEKDFGWDNINDYRKNTLHHMNMLINYWRTAKELKNKTRIEFYFRQMIQDLPDAYLQKRTCTSDYQTERNKYFARKNHKQREWREYCKMLETLPYGKELICYKG